MENHEVDALRGALRQAFERSPDLEPRSDFIAGLAQLRHSQASPEMPAVRRRSIGRWLAAAATFALLTTGGYWTFEARLSADPLRDAAVGGHRYCALGLSTDGRDATDITSLPEAASRYESGFRVLEDVPHDDVPTSDGSARVLNRHSCVFAGRRFAHIILQYRGTPVSLLVARGAAASSFLDVRGMHSLTTARSKDLTLMSVRTREYAVFIVGSLPAAQLSPLADALSGEVVRALAKI